MPVAICTSRSATRLCAQWTTQACFSFPMAPESTPPLKLATFQAIVRPATDGDVEACVRVQTTSGLSASSTLVRFEGGADISIDADEECFAISIKETGAPGGPDITASFEGGWLRLTGKGWGKGRGARPY